MLSSFIKVLSYLQTNEIFNHYTDSDSTLQRFVRTLLKSLFAPFSRRSDTTSLVALPQRFSNTTDLYYTLTFKRTSILAFSNP